MYLERLTNAGIEDSEYYVRSGADTDMPNCTRYAYDRAKESCQDLDLKIARASGGFGNAKTWYDTTTYPKGSKLRQGAIAVFDGTYGHVAYVERVIDDTHAIVTQSNYNANKSLRNWWYWEKREYELVVGKAISGTGALKGFIYCPINDIRVGRDISKNQVEVIAELVNVRKSPSLNGDKYIGQFCPLGIYNVFEWVDADGYTWAKLEENCYIACGEWAKVYKVEDKEKAELIKENKALKEKLRKIGVIVNGD